MIKNAVITGAGSGVGQATAIALAEQGWRVALLGRRAQALQETVKLAGARASQMLVCPCDIGDAEAVNRAAQHILGAFEEVEVLVNAAGTNAPRRALAVLSLADYHDMMNANLNGASKRTVYVKVKPRLELASAMDEAGVRAALPRLLDLFQTYLREMRPEELRGSVGTYRLREELLARANIATAPARIVDVLFAELLIQ